MYFCCIDAKSSIQPLDYHLEGAKCASNMLTNLLFHSYLFVLFGINLKLQFIESGYSYQVLINFFKSLCLIMNHYSKEKERKYDLTISYYKIWISWNVSSTEKSSNIIMIWQEIISLHSTLRSLLVYQSFYCLVLNEPRRMPRHDIYLFWIINLWHLQPIIIWLTLLSY